MENEFKPNIGATCLYKELGGVKWCMCKVIAKYEGKVWVHNFYTGSMPVKGVNELVFKPLPKDDGKAPCN